MSTEIAKKLIIDAKSVGRQEMAIRRTNSGIAGSIAQKVTNRRKWDNDYQPLTFEEQSAALTASLTAEEIDYAKQVWE